MCGIFKPAISGRRRRSILPFISRVFRKLSHASSVPPASIEPAAASGNKPDDASSDANADGASGGISHGPAAAGDTVDPYRSLPSDLHKLSITCLPDIENPSANKTLGKKIFHPERPRNHNRPWLPRFPDLTRRYPPGRSVPAGSNFTAVSFGEPGSFAYDFDVSIQPGLQRLPSQISPLRLSYNLARESLSQQDIPVIVPYTPEDLFRPQPDFLSLLLGPKLAPRACRPPANPDTVFVEINGIRTNKRRAEDHEVDLVAAVEVSTHVPASSIAITRKGFAPASDFEVPEQVQAPMLPSKRVSRRIAGMMSNLLCTVSGLTGKFRRLFHNDAYEISEARTYVKIPKNAEVHVANKRVKITSELSNLQWLDDKGLRLLLGRYSHFCHLFNTASSIIHGHPSRAEMNKLLQPLLPFLVSDSRALNTIRVGRHDTDLCELWISVCKVMIAHLDGVYEVGKFIRMKSKYSRVPTIWPDAHPPAKLETVSRIKIFLSAPSLFLVLESILKFSKRVDNVNPNLPLPTDIIDRVVVDMTAYQRNMVLPSFVKSEQFYLRLLEQFPNRGRLPSITDLAYPVPPGTYPGFRHGFHLLDYYDEDSLVSAYSTPRDTNSFVSSEELTDAQIGAVQAILRNRKTPKRLIARTPKRVRFVQGDIKIQQKTQPGADTDRQSADSKHTDEPAFSDDGSNSSVSVLQGWADDLERAYKKAFEDFGYGWPAPGPSTRDEKRLGDETSNLNEQECTGLLQYEYCPSGTQNSESKASVDNQIEPSQAIQKLMSKPMPNPLGLSDEALVFLKTNPKEDKKRMFGDIKHWLEQHTKRLEAAKLEVLYPLRAPARPLVSPLNSSWLEKARATLTSSPLARLAITGQGVTLRRHDFERLVPPTAWLNDEIVNASLHWLQRYINSAAGVDISKGMLRCFAFSSFFFKHLQQHGVANTDRSARRAGLWKKHFFSLDTILLPICEHSHWTLLIIRPIRKAIAHMDSLNPEGSQEYIRLGLAWINQYTEEIEPFVPDEWEIERFEAPAQTNGYDCGVHTITNGMCIALGLKPNESYTAKDMPQQRLRLAAMLLNEGFGGDFDLGGY